MTDFQHTVTEEENGRAIKDLIRHHFSFSSRLMTKLKFQQLIDLNGQPAPGWIPVTAGDVITIHLPEETSNFAAEPIPIDIVYEDEHLLILNKQAGVAVHPTKGKPDHTIANGLMYKMMQNGEHYKIRFVNRLDMNTSGLLIVAKNGFVQEEIIKQMRKNQVDKRYIAVVTGVLAEEEGVIDLPLGRPFPDEVERWVVPEQDGGAPSVTHYQVLQRFNGYTLLQLKLDTGRTHQIRIHLSYIGYPIVGDHLYCHGDPFAYRRRLGIRSRDEHEEKVSPYIDRQALHAFSLTFCHPISGQRIHVEAPLPADMCQLIQTLQELP